MIWKKKIAETKLIKDNSKPGLTLPDATEFFSAFKQKIKYNAIEDFNLISFLQGTMFLGYIFFC